MFLLSLAILALRSGLLAVHAQTDNIFTAQPIRTSDGSCLSAVGSYDNAPVFLQPCDNSAGQKWDVSVGGQYITESGFAIFILSGTNSCLDSIAYDGSPGIYTCGGRSDGLGSQSSHQAFTYSSFTGVTGPLVLIPSGECMNHGQGPGQSCLSAAQDMLELISCDASTTTPQEQFYIGPPPAAPTQPTYSPPPFQPPPFTQPTNFPNSPQPSHNPQSTQFTQATQPPQRGQSTQVPSDQSSSDQSTQSSVSTQSDQPSGSLHSDHSPHASGSLQSDQSGSPQSPQSPHSDDIPQSSQSASSSNGALPVGNNSPSRRSVNTLAIAIPSALVALIALLIAFLFFRRRRSAKTGEMRNARPFSATLNGTKPAQVFVPSKGAMVGFSGGSSSVSPQPATVASSGAVTSAAREENDGTESSTQSRHLPRTQPFVGLGMNPADIDHIVSLVAARIDPLTGRNHPDASLSNLTADLSARSLNNLSSTQSPGLSTASPMTPSSPPPANVNIDTILSLLASRVDPAFRAQNDFRDSQDRPPSYLVPPDYDV